MDSYIFDIQADMKPEVEPAAVICRCCLSTEKRMKDVSLFSSLFMDLAGINVLQSDNLPRWVCWECAALMARATRFKRKMLRAHTLLYEYSHRCAPFPIDAHDPELEKCAASELGPTAVLAFDNSGRKSGFHKPLQHNKLSLIARACAPPPPPAAPAAPCGGEGEGEDIKQEMSFSDYEDNINLEEYRLNVSRLSEDELVAGLAVTEESLAQLLEVSESLQAEKKKKRERKKKKNSVKALPPEEDVKSSVRRPLELDPAKIRLVTLNPEEQIKQREEESKASLKFPFQCHLCFKGFNFESKLQNHMHKHSPSRGKYECKLCQMFLPTVYSFRVHSAIHTQRYECVRCALRMQDRASILRHYRTQHEGVVTIFTCHICGKVCNNNKTLRGHMRNHHSGSRPACDQCGKSFVNKDSLNEHLQIHQGVKNYECGTCGKRFRTRTQIKHHQLKHTDQRDFYCVECDTRFKSAHSLRQHLVKSLKHKDEQTLKYECSACDKRFESEARLRHHYSVQHEGLRPHRCEECGATLATLSSLHKHRRSVHGGHRPPQAHQCHACGKAFRGKSVLINHVRTHTGEKPFACAECGRAFAQRAALRTHRKLVHRDKGGRGHGKPPEIKAELPPCPPLDKDLFPKVESASAGPWRVSLPPALPPPQPPPPPAPAPHPCQVFYHVTHT